MTVQSTRAAGQINPTRTFALRARRMSFARIPYVSDETCN